MQQAIDILDEMIGENQYKGSCMPKYSRNQIKALWEAKSRIQAQWSGWIPTSIRLPEPNRNVLLWEGWYELLELNEPIIGWYDTRYWFRTKWDWPIATHWMPLPLPPKQ